MRELPKDARIFLADIGYGLYPCIYSPSEGHYVMARPTQDMYKGMADISWVNQWVRESEIERWTEINEPS